MSSDNNSFHINLRRISRLLSARGPRPLRGKDTKGRERIKQPGSASSKEPENDARKQHAKHDSAMFLEEPTTTAVKNPAIHKLPVEIIQEIASYLSKHEKASFCLSSRFTCYAIGTEELHGLLRTAFHNKFDRRANTVILERAFPSHWFCAWCDKFHRHEHAGGPQNFQRETKRACAQHNSFLHCEPKFMVAYHHVRLAMNRHLWGPDYGISLDEFSFSSTRSLKILRVGCEMETHTKARIVGNQFILHGRGSLTIPLRLRPQPGVAGEIIKAMPQVVVHHRSREPGHRELTKTIQKFLAEMPPQEFFQSPVTSCGQCCTDYQVTCRYQGPPQSHLRTIEVVVEVWRNLGVGRSPFETLWRGHGDTRGQKVVGKDKQWNSSSSSKAGEIKEAFEHEGEPERFGQFGTLHGEGLLPKLWHDPMELEYYKRFTNVC